MKKQAQKFLLYGVHCLVIAFLFFIFSIFTKVTWLNITWLTFSAIGVILLVLNFLFSLAHRQKREIMVKSITNKKLSVAVTAYDDELSIGDVVKDFYKIPAVEKVIVIDNNSTDRTTPVAIEAGAEVISERVQGYGATCKRGLIEASKSSELIALIEGDGTFSAQDLDKFLAYIENADMVIGTRTTRELSAHDCQMNWFMQYGNLFMAKLIQMVFWDIRLTDVGCTYRLIRKEALSKIIGQLKINGNHFGCEMTLAVLKNGLKVIEIPVTFRKRVGKSKGVGRNIRKGLVNGIKMWWLILTI